METRSKHRERMKNRLDAMPEEVMKHILKDCDFFDFMALRNTCTHTRRMVNLINPDPKLEFLSIHWMSTNMILHFGFVNSEKCIRSSFENQDGGCMVTGTNEGWAARKFVADTSAERMFLQGLKILLPLLKNQRTPLERFYVERDVGVAASFQETVVPLFRDLDIQVRSAEVLLIIHEGINIMPMLSLASPDGLTELRIVSRKGELPALDLSEALESEQWRSARHFDLLYTRPSTPQCFLRCQSSFMQIDEVTPEYVSMLKETFRAVPPTFGHFCLCVPGLRYDLTQIERAISETGGRDKTWYFSTANPDFVLKINIVEYQNYINFFRVASRSLGSAHVILD